MKRIDKLNGLKNWWNSLAKDDYKILFSADELKEMCLSEYESTGSVEIRFYQSKDNRPHYFYK